MVSFTRNHNIKFLLFALLTAGLVLAANMLYKGDDGARKKNKIDKKELSPNEANDFLKQENNLQNVVVLDLRTPGEYAEGHIKGSIFVDYFAPGFKQRLSALDRDKSYIIYCKAGRICAKVLKKMKTLGFKEAHKITGGMNGWKTEKLPVDLSKQI